MALSLFPLACSLLSAAVSAWSWLTYLRAQWAQDVKASATYWAAAFLVAVDEFVVTRTHSSTLACVTFAVSAVGCLGVVVLNLNRRQTVDKYDAAVMTAAMFALGAVHWVPRLVLLAAAGYSVVSAGAYIQKIRNKSVREPVNPWLWSVLSSGLMGLGMLDQPPQSWLLPLLNFIGCTGIAWAALRAAPPPPCTKPRLPSNQDPPMPATPTIRHALEALKSDQTPGECAQLTLRQPASLVNSATGVLPALSVDALRRDGRHIASFLRAHLPTPTLEALKASLRTP